MAPFDMGAIYSCKYSYSSMLYDFQVTVFDVELS